MKDLPLLRHELFCLLLALALKIIKTCNIVQSNVNNGNPSDHSLSGLPDTALVSTFRQIYGTVSAQRYHQCSLRIEDCRDIGLSDAQKTKQFPQCLECCCFPSLSG